MDNVIILNGLYETTKPVVGKPVRISHYFNFQRNASKLASDAKKDMETVKQAIANNINDVIDIIPIRIDTKIVASSRAIRINGNGVVEAKKKFNKVISDIVKPVEKVVKDNKGHSTGMEEKTVNLAARPISQIAKPENKISFVNDDNSLDKKLDMQKVESNKIESSKADSFVKSSSKKDENMEAEKRQKPFAYNPPIRKERDSVDKEVIENNEHKTLSADINRKDDYSADTNSKKITMQANMIKEIREALEEQRRRAAETQKNQEEAAKRAEEARKRGMEMAQNKVLEHLASEYKALKDELAKEKQALEARNNEYKAKMTQEDKDYKDAIAAMYKEYGINEPTEELKRVA